MSSWTQRWRSIPSDRYDRTMTSVHTSQESLAEYIARPPISLKKIRYEPFSGL
jgi:hypothetical protein